MRDFLCFEKHLVQAFEAVGRLRGTPTSIPQAWYERPIFYHPNRFSVCGPDADVPWPSYSERLAFALEIGCYIFETGDDSAHERAHVPRVLATNFTEVSSPVELTNGH